MRGIEKKKVGKRKIILIASTIIIGVSILLVTVFLTFYYTKQKQPKDAIVSTKEIKLNTKNMTEIDVGKREDMIKLSISINDQKQFEIQRKTSLNDPEFKEWYITEPYSYDILVNPSGLYHFLDCYATWYYLDVAEDKKCFEESNTYITIGFSDGERKVIIGNQNKDENYYVKYDNSDVIYIMDKEMINTLLNLNPFDFIMKISSLVYLTTIDELDVNIASKKYHFDVKINDISSEYYMNNNKIDEKDFKKIYSSIIGIKILKEAGRKVDDNKPVLTLMFHRKLHELEDVTVAYLKYDKQYYAIALNGKVEFLVSKKAVNDLIKEIER